MQTERSSTPAINRYNKLFSGGLGRFAGGKATLRVREGATPVFCRARPLPYALKDRVDAELDAMLREGVIEPVESSDWATPLVPHVFTAPYHPASNGAAENAVRTVKKVIKKAVRENKDINLFLNTFLLHYRNTEHCTTGESPASLMLGRRLRTKLDVLRPDIENKIIKTQINQKENAPTGERGLQPGEDVWLRRYQGSDKWTAGQVTQRLGVTDYKVLDTIGKESHKHIDQLKRRIRSSLICPRSSNSQTNSSSESLSCTGAEEINAPRINPAVKDTGRKSKAPEGTEIIDKSDCLDTARETSTLRAPSAHTSPVPPATPPQVFRPVRKCRLDNPPSYKE
ncbi:unnamed protein product [Parnassius mnemosyne]|uniref:Integrase catalytic domain-containing protein n=1 Tax=Parnassius mnemosyne TaxID=213953 RepID=A0AAV1KC60_9NEOP